MRRCLRIAAFAQGGTSPNPMVGAVVVCDGEIIAEGYHHKAGEPHAEPNAIAAVKDEALLHRCTLYVSLEPCSHYGKTPPCAELIIKKGIPRVVVGMLDPNPLVAGRGVKMMSEAGIEVVVAVLEEECRYLNRRFITFHTKHRPYVMLKWAQTADGYIDLLRTEKGDGPVRISNEVTKTLNHQVRVQEDAILVGTQTALLDDPHLTSRKWSGKNPVRCVIDLKGRLPNNLQMWNDEARTIRFVGKGVEEEIANVESVVVDEQRGVVTQILEELYNRNIQSVIIEGGTTTLNLFVESGMWDEARIETSNNILGSGVKSPHIEGVEVREKRVYGNRTSVIIPTVLR